jgi:tRNA G18 (ribose-2'-O)-methylase SpoU
MNIIPINDPSDVRLDPYRDMKHEDVRRRGELFIAEGKLVVQRLLASDYQTESVLAEANRIAWVQSLIAPQTPVYVVPPELIREVAGFNFHRGLLACGRRIRFAPADQLFQIIQSRLAVAAISVNDLENLGSLIRTAAAFGIEHLALNRQTIDPLCRRVLRVSMGAALKLQYFDLDDPVAWLQENQQRGCWYTIATTLSDDSIPLSTLPQPAGFGAQRRMILMGNEGDGLPADVQAACTVRAKIPMAPGIDSLNISIAAAIAIYELVRAEPST